MQELRFVLIVVGGLAIAALLFHGLWTSKKEGKAKFGDKPLGKLDNDLVDEQSLAGGDFAPAPEDDFEIIRKDRKEPDFGSNDPFEKNIESDPLINHDPLIDGVPDTEPVKKPSAIVEQESELPAFSAVADEEVEIEAPVVQPKESLKEPLESSLVEDTEEQALPEVIEPNVVEEPKPEPEMQVIILNVHCAGEDPFVGTKLFDSLQQNGLIYGEMNIFHRHVDLSGNGKVLFSVANMMHPGTLEHGDPAEFTTKGISFFMTLPCYGEADQNFNLMLRIAQQVADDMGGNVLDDQRNLMTPDRLASYRRQIVEFNATNA
ncbi:Cell division protein ZipA [Vibrio rotiferianus]|uniref:cell division protein ZipA n=1 Tax=Vibrio rotiferianus TaxID=190895 RepID=UPI002895F20A|nr:Cell division protein ZipA [Vibrio rotiferianus]